MSVYFIILFKSTSDLIMTSFANAVGPAHLDSGAGIAHVLGAA